jgi:hypothetical protein
MHVKADDVADLFYQQRVLRQLEGLGSMRLKSKRSPDLANGRAPEPTRLGHLARTPLRRALRRFFEGAHNHLFDFGIGDAARCAGPRFVVQPVEAITNKPAAPFADRRLRHPQALRDGFVIVPLRAGQNDPGPARQMGRRPRSMRQRLELHAVVVGQNQRNFRASQSHARLLVDEYDRAAPLISLCSRTAH